MATAGMAKATASAATEEEPAHDTRLNVRSYGAAGDGESDDSAACQRAINECVASGGGSIYFPPGKYRITRSLTVASAARMDFVGEGTSSRLLHEMDEPLLLWNENASCRECSVRHLVFVSTVKNKSHDTPVIACLAGMERSFFSHITFLSDGANIGSGVETRLVADTSTFDHCLLWGITGTGLKLARGSEVRIFGGRIIGAETSEKAPFQTSVGVHLTGDNGGVHIVTTDIIRLNTGLLIGQDGMKSNREVFITHATFDSSIHGIRQTDHTFVSIAGCWAASSDENQILVEESAAGAQMVISGGTIFNGGAIGRPGAHDGIVMMNGSLVMTGVSVRHNKGTGIKMGPAAHNYSITGCRISNNGTGAVLRGNNYVFNSNIVTQNLAGLQDLGGPDKSLEGNLINRNP